MNFTINEWIDNVVLYKLDMNENIKSYIYSLYKKMMYVKNDISDQSLVIMYNNASLVNNFEQYQTIGDYVLWAASYCPDSIVEYELALDIGKLSYYSCYNLLHKKWLLYNELAENMEIIVKLINKNIKKHQ